jgi:hypothetical protein
MFLCELRLFSSSDPCGIDAGRCLSCERCVRNNETKDELPPPPPTNAQPGSDAKVRILQWRLENDFGLWNPHDAAPGE